MIDKSTHWADSLGTRGGEKPRNVSVCRLLLAVFTSYFKKDKEAISKKMRWFGGRNTTSWSLEIWNFIETSQSQWLGISLQKVLKDRDTNKKLSVIFPPELTCFRCHERSRHREQEKLFFNVDKKKYVFEELVWCVFIDT